MLISTASVTKIYTRSLITSIWFPSSIFPIPGH